jgi:hypothetical protein
VSWISEPHTWIPPVGVNQARKRCVVAGWKPVAVVMRHWQPPPAVSVVDAIVVNDVAPGPRRWDPPETRGSVSSRLDLGESPRSHGAARVRCGGRCAMADPRCG